MKYKVSTQGFERDGSALVGLATVVFDDQFVIKNIKLIQGKEQLFIGMPSYKSNELDDQGKNKYKDICYPGTAEFREEMYSNILTTFQEKSDGRNAIVFNADTKEKLKPSVRVTPINQETDNQKNLKGLATITLNDSFVISNVKVSLGKNDHLFVSYPQYKTNKMSEKDGKPIYESYCNPITSECSKSLSELVLFAYANEVEKLKADPEQEKNIETEPKKEAAKKKERSR